MKNLVPLPPYDDNVRRITYPTLMWRKDGYRKVIWIYFNNGTRKRLNYARYKMEIFLGYELDKKLHIHHKNGNKLDDRICNLEILEIGKHTKLHSTLNDIPIFRKCIVCNLDFSLTIQQRSDERNNNKPKRKFCSTKCSMKYQYNWKLNNGC